VDEASTTTTIADQVGPSSPDVPSWVLEFFRCKRWIESALASSPLVFFTLRDIFDAIYDGKAFLWAGENSCHVIEITTICRRRVAVAWLAGGDLSELLAMTPAIEKWARDQKGCDVALVTGRRGWLKPLSGSGYKELHTTMGKAL